jgi:hypothetical protein
MSADDGHKNEIGALSGTDGKELVLKVEEHVADLPQPEQAT